MKKDIHPQYNKDITITCSCGNVFKTGSTSDNMVVEICSNCHPFYTGKSKMLDAQGRVERFKKRMEQKSAKPTKTKKEKKAGAKAKKEAKKVEK